LNLKLFQLLILWDPWDYNVWNWFFFFWGLIFTRNFFTENYIENRCFFWGPAKLVNHIIRKLATWCTNLSPRYWSMNEMGFFLLEGGVPVIKFNNMELQQKVGKYKRVILEIQLVTLLVTWIQSNRKKISKNFKKHNF
jgi:hypothetical protein